MITVDDATLRHYYRECYEGAVAVCGKTPPSDHYAQRVARFMFATVVHESKRFAENRQMGFPGYDNNAVGAFSFFQVEKIAIADAWLQLRANGPLRLNACRYVFRASKKRAAINLPVFWFDEMPGTLTVSISFRAAFVVARCRMFRDPDPIPGAPRDMAKKWGTVYNTRNEADKINQWFDAHQSVQYVVDDEARKLRGTVA